MTDDFTPETSILFCKNTINIKNPNITRSNGNHDRRQAETNKWKTSDGLRRKHVKTHSKRVGVFEPSALVVINRVATRLRVVIRAVTNL